MEKRSLEPGVLPIFRLFTGLRLAFAVILALARIVAPEPTIRAIDILEPGVLMLILSLPALRTQHERILLPIALVVAGIGPLVTQADSLVDISKLRLPITTILALQTWGSMIVLLLPVLIIAWQYRLKQVVIFSSSITVLNMGLICQTAGSESLKEVLVMGSLMFRLITFIMIGGLVARLMEGQREQRNALREANLKLTHHAATLEQLAITRERNRLARELHDTLAHTLSAVAVQLEAVDALWETRPNDAQRRLQTTIEATRSGLTETRRALQDLRASPLDDLGLALAIRELAEAIALRGGLKLYLHIADHLPNVSSDIEQAIYRIAQEALENVVNHANAHTLRVQLARPGAYLILKISDDGQGFNPVKAPPTRRFGLQGMHERAEMIGGTLEVESEPGKGTTLVLLVEVGT